MAIEPSTCHALGRPHAEAHGELAWLKHGDERTYELRFSVLKTQSEIARFEAAVRNAAPEILDNFAAPREGFGQS